MNESGIENRNSIVPRVVFNPKDAGNGEKKGSMPI